MIWWILKSSLPTSAKLDTNVNASCHRKDPKSSSFLKMDLCWHQLLDTGGGEDVWLIVLLCMWDRGASLLCEHNSPTMSLHKPATTEDQRRPVLHLTTILFVWFMDKSGTQIFFSSNRKSTDSWAQSAIGISPISSFAEGPLILEI